MWLRIFPPNRTSDDFSQMSPRSAYYQFEQTAASAPMGSVRTSVTLQHRPLPRMPLPSHRPNPDVANIVKCRDAAFTRPNFRCACMIQFPSNSQFADEASFRCSASKVCLLQLACLQGYRYVIEQALCQGKPARGIRPDRLHSPSWQRPLR